MPLFLPFRRAGTHEKVLQVSSYSLAAILALLVVMPFVFLLALSFGDVTEQWEGSKWPSLRHFVNPKRLYVHYLSTKYDYFADMYGFNDLYGRIAGESGLILSVEESKLPEPKGNWQVRARDGYDCLKSMPWSFLQVLFTGWGYRGSGGVIMTSYTGLGNEAWKDFLRAKFGTITAVNERFGTTFETFSHVILPGIGYINSRMYLLGDPQNVEFASFITSSAPPDYKTITLGRWWFQWWLRTLPEIGTDIAKLNRALGTGYKNWYEVTLSEALPTNPLEAKYWAQYAAKVVSPEVIELVDATALTEKYRKFLVAQHGSGEGVLGAYGASPELISLPARVRDVMPTATAYYDWDAFVRTVPASGIRLVTPEVIWRRYLESKFAGSVEEMSRAYGVQYASFAEVPWPQIEMDRADWEAGKGKYIREILFKNYRRVWNWMTEGTSAATANSKAPALMRPIWSFISGGGGAIMNTALFALLFTVLAVAVSTGAGYVLSRFALGPLQMAMVYFLALAAFPIEAIAVPNFLLLRKLGLLNTVWALVLPTAVNGYYIYLMKGFFDGIPKDYFEEATIYGADEWSLFRRVGLPFARPMMSVVALYAFLWSYSNFMWALIVCQQRPRWTMPVLLFNINAWMQPPCILAAAMVMTLIPPLIVFAVSHRTLQRALTLPR